MRKEQKQGFPFHTPSPLSAGNGVHCARNTEPVQCSVQCMQCCTVHALYSTPGIRHPSNKNCLILSCPNFLLGSMSKSYWPWMEVAICFCHGEKEFYLGECLMILNILSLTDLPRSSLHNPHHSVFIRIQHHQVSGSVHLLGASLQRNW